MQLPKYKCLFTKPVKENGKTIALYFNH